MWPFPKEWSYFGMFSPESLDILKYIYRFTNKLVKIIKRVPPYPCSVFPHIQMYSQDDKDINIVLYY